LVTVIVTVVSALGGRWSIVFSGATLIAGGAVVVVGAGVGSFGEVVVTRTEVVGTGVDVVVVVAVVGKVAPAVFKSASLRCVGLGLEAAAEPHEASRSPTKPMDATDLKHLPLMCMRHRRTEPVNR